MCARYTIYHSTSDIVDRFDVRDILFEISPRYNIAPQNTAPVISLDDGRATLQGYRWGLVPSWASDPSIGQKMFNARAETIAEKPAFARSLTRRRCIVPADGFYEWIPQDKERQPLHIQFNGAPLFGIAGIWAIWQRQDETPVYSFAIVTVPANSLIAGFHTRMPAILRPQDEAMWLDSDFHDGRAAATLLQPYDPADMRAFKVDKKVNRAGYEDPSCIAPLVEPLTLAL